MSKGLTERQKEILDFIKCYIDENNFPPTVKEIAENFKISLKGSHDHIKALRKKKYISFEDKKRRAIKLLVMQGSSVFDDDSISQEIPVLGSVQAGLPILSVENFEGKIKIFNKMFGDGELFGLKVRGDSMIDEGIVEGDTAIIRCVNYFDNGDIVVAATENGVTLKKAYKDEKNLRLEPANKRYSPILTKNARIVGKLVGLIRKY